VSTGASIASPASHPDTENRQLRKFLARYRLREADIAPKKLPYVAVAVGEWYHQLRAGSRARTTFAVMQFLAPIAAATATVLAAFSSTSAWAVIPSAVTTVGATLLASFPLRATWFLRKRVRHEIAQEIIEFVQECGEYRGLDEAASVDRLMGKVRVATMTTAQMDAPTNHVNHPPP